MCIEESIVDVEYSVFLKSRDESSRLVFKASKNQNKQFNIEIVKSYDQDYVIMKCSLSWCSSKGGLMPAPVTVDGARVVPTF